MWISRYQYFTPRFHRERRILFCSSCRILTVRNSKLTLPLPHSCCKWLCRLYTWNRLPSSELLWVMTFLHSVNNIFPTLLSKKELNFLEHCVVNECVRYLQFLAWSLCHLTKIQRLLINFLQSVLTTWRYTKVWGWGVSAASYCYLLKWWTVIDTGKTRNFFKIVFLQEIKYHDGRAKTSLLPHW